MARLPAHLQIETRHVLTAIMGGDAACAKIMATMLVDALADAGVLPLTDLPVRPVPAPRADDGGTRAPPPQAMETISSATSNEGGKINTAASGRDEPAARVVTLKGAPVDPGKFRRMWFADPGLAEIAERLSCSVPVVLRLGKDFGLPARRSAAWERERASIVEPAATSAADRSEAAPPRKRCAFLVDAGRNGTTRCLDEPIAGKVYCPRHLSESRAARGAA